jgi:hypothetical protein
VTLDPGSPISIAVIAVEVIASPENPSFTVNDFENAAVQLTDIGAVGLDVSGQALTVAFEPDAGLAVSLTRLDEVMVDFEERSAPARLRALIHHGTAFRTRASNGLPIFQGSALRSAAKSLQRSTLPGGVYASPEFLSLVANFKGMLGCQILRAQGEYAQLAFASRRKQTGQELHSTDADLVGWLKARLAKDLGPFAAALVDNASHSTRTAKELAAAVGHEIVDPHLRRRFDADVFRYIASRGL